MDESKRIQEVFRDIGETLQDPRRIRWETFWRGPRGIQETLNKDLIGAPGNHIGIAAWMRQCTPLMPGHRAEVRELTSGHTLVYSLGPSAWQLTQNQP